MSDDAFFTLDKRFMDVLTEGASQEKAGLSLVGDLEVGESSQQCSG